MCVPSRPKPGYTSSAMKMPPALRITSTAGEESGRSGKSAAAGEHVSVEERCRYFVRPYSLPVQATQSSMGEAGRLQSEALINYLMGKTG
jgi:hypothetical protein